MEVEKIYKHHFTLVHGACHGAWCWFKVKTLLEAAGHRVTVMDLAASGIDTRSITEIKTWVEYTEPLLKLLSLLPSDEKVVLVGHSSGGVGLALAMEKFPKKISVAVFLTAFMPDTKHSPSYVLEEPASNMAQEAKMGIDQSFFFSIDSMKFGLYQLSPIEDLELALTLERPGSLFMNDLSKMNNFSDEGYGSVARAYIMCKDDKSILKEYQQWMIDNFPVDLVVEIEESDHMAMISKPKEVCEHLVEIAKKFV